MAVTFRDSARRWSPARLLTDQAQRFVYAVLGLPFDGIAQAARDAGLQGLVSDCTDDALPYHGRDRRIVRGPGEPRAGYVARLLGWLNAWQLGGVGGSLMDQIAAYLTPHQVRMRLITDQGIWYTREADGTLTIEHHGAALWDWDGVTNRWARFWLVIYPTAGLWTPGPNWGDSDLWGGSWGSPGYTWGSTAMPNQVQTIRGLVKQWKPAFAKCENIIIAFDDASFDKTSLDLPAGEYGSWAMDDGAGTWVPARLATARYWDGV